MKTHYSRMQIAIHPFQSVVAAVHTRGILRFAAALAVSACQRPGPPPAPTTTKAKEKPAAPSEERLRRWGKALGLPVNWDMAIAISRDHWVVVAAGPMVEEPPTEEEPPTGEETPFQRVIPFKLALMRGDRPVWTDDSTVACEEDPSVNLSLVHAKVRRHPTLVRLGDICKRGDDYFTGTEYATLYRVLSDAKGRPRELDQIWSGSADEYRSEMTYCVHTKTTTFTWSEDLCLLHIKTELEDRWDGPAKNSAEYDREFHDRCKVKPKRVTRKTVQLCKRRK